MKNKIIGFLKGKLPFLKTNQEKELERLDLEVEALQSVLVYFECLAGFMEETKNKTINSNKGGNHVISQ